MKTINWNVKNMPYDLKQRIKEKAEAAGVTIPEALEIYERQISRAEFIQLSKLRSNKRGEE